MWCRDLGIPSNHACRAARRMNQARNRTAVNTLFMRIASNLYIKMAAPGQPFSKEKTFSPWEGNFKLFNSLFHSVYLVFSIRLFSIANFFARYLWDVRNEDKFCVVTHRAVNIRVAWLVYLVCLRSHVLRAYCNFESKQANSITLFGRRPNNNKCSKHSLLSNFILPIFSKHPWTDSGYCCIRNIFLKLKRCVFRCFNNTYK